MNTYSFRNHNTYTYLYWHISLLYFHVVNIAFLCSFRSISCVTSVASWSGHDIALAELSVFSANSTLNHSVQSSNSVLSNLTCLVQNGESVQSKINCLGYKKIYHSNHGPICMTWLVQSIINCMHNLYSENEIVSASLALVVEYCYCFPLFPLKSSTQLESLSLLLRLNPLITVVVNNFIGNLLTISGNCRLGVNQKKTVLKILWLLHAIFTCNISYS